MSKARGFQIQKFVEYPRKMRLTPLEITFL
jgi:hypothetical protein